MFAKRVALLAGAVLLGSAAVALAASAVGKGLTYTSATGAKEAVTFKVSASGKQVTGLSASTPIVCPGVNGVGGVAGVTGGSASINKKGKFDKTFKLIFAPTHASEGQETITGKFLSGHRESGTVTSHFTNNKTCHGLTRSYTTTGAAA